VAQNEISMKILDEKMEYIASVEPEIVATANVGCMLQLSAGAKRKGLNSRVVHVVELLDEAY
jgi:glycolate oxidase iron-sulfur subunit